MRKVIVLLMFVAAGLTGCNRGGETAITGGYGSSAVSGEVFLSGVPNTSPAGVRVSVRGTGMTAVLGDDGRFAFANMPEGAVLDFSRAQDSIEASLALEGAGPHVRVELSRAAAVATTASNKSGRRRAGARGGQKVYEFEGVIRSAAADSIVVFTSKKEEVTIALRPETVIRKGNTALTPADLTADTRVHVKASLANDVYSAVLVIVQNRNGGEDDPPAPAVREYEGRVVRSTATELVVLTSHKEEVTFLITDDTEIRKGQATMNLAQVLAGMLVHVRASTNADGTSTALLVIVQNTNVKVTAEGTVTSIAGSSFVLTTSEGELTVETGPSTQIRRANEKVAFSEIAVGAQAKVEGTLTGASTLAAKKITL